jgi:hypothetical protein
MSEYQKIDLSEWMAEMFMKQGRMMDAAYL